jgi:hypothetical protein
MPDTNAVTMLLMFFVAAPGDLQSATDKATSERTVAWTLQSTQQVEVPSPDLCNQYADKIVALVNPVATMTVRVYCLCPFSKTVKDPKTGKQIDECLDNPSPAIKNFAGPQYTPGIQVIGPKFPPPSKR